MKRRFRRRPVGRSVPALALGIGLLAVSASATLAQNQLITGKKITLPPLGKTVSVGNLPTNLVVSPDGKYAVSTNSGFQEYLSVVDTATGSLKSQVSANGNGAPLNSLYYGLVFDPTPGPDSSYTLYAGLGGSAGIAVLKLDSAGLLTYVETIKSAQQPKSVKGFEILGSSGDFTTGLALDGHNRLYVANNAASAFLNATSLAFAPGPNNIPLSLFGGPPGVYLVLNFPHGSLSVIDRAGKTELGRYDFFSDPVGLVNFPLAVSALADGSKCYVGTQRDNVLYVLNTTDPANITLTKTLATGAHSVALALNKTQTTLYVGSAINDSISVVDTGTDTITQTIDLRPLGAKSLAGVSPTGLSLSPDEKTLYAALSDMNAVAVIDVTTGKLKGYIPAGWNPTGVVATNKNILVSNAKGMQTRYPTPLFKTQIQPPPTDFDSAQYDLFAIQGNIETIPLPSALQLLQDTQMTLANNRITPTTDKPTVNALANIGLQSKAPYHIQHVIYMIKENRTFDQVMGDLGADVPGVNADPSLVLFDKTVTPNQHALMKRFVTMDNFYNAGEVSSDGWTWCTGSFANENVTKYVPYNYSNRPGHQDDSTGQSNGYLVGGHPARDVDGKTLSSLFPAGAPAIPDAAQGSPKGHIWDLARAAGLSYRNYGFFVSVGFPPLLPDNYPAVPGVQPEGHDLAGITDYDFRQFDLNYADSDAPSDYNCPAPTRTYGKHGAKSRFAEWNTEFQQIVARDQANGKPVGTSFPSFMTVRFMRDHTAGFSKGNGTPKALVADNDYSVGQLVQAISQYPDLWKSTAIFVIEDDSQDGPDHVDAHRSTGYVISPWIKKGSLDHAFYNTDSILHTMELLMGTPALSQYDATADVIRAWDTAPNNAAPYLAIEPSKSVICDLVTAMNRKDPRFQLAALSAKMDFKHTDAADPHLLNEILWKSVKGMHSKMPAPRHNVLLASKAAPTSAHTKAATKTAHRDDDD